MATRVGKGKQVGKDEAEKPADINVVSKEEAAEIKPDLPPAGWKRDEELARRQEELEKTGEDVAKKIGMFSVDFNKFKPDPEIMRQLRGDPTLRVSKSKRGYHYCWVTVSGIRSKKDAGFELVKGDDQEAKEHAEVYDTINDRAEGLRKVGDVILMRCPMAVYERILIADAYERAKRQYGENSKLLKQAEKKGVEVSNLTDKDIKSLFDHEFARKQAFKVLKETIEEGRIPQMPTEPDGTA